MNIQSLFFQPLNFDSQNFVDLLDKNIIADNQTQTADVFSHKWINYAKRANEAEQQRLWDFQKHWYLKLYGFEDFKHLATFLQSCPIIFDAGCGLGYLSDWFAELAPNSLVIGMDISDALNVAKQRYHRPNLYFIRGDIANTPFKDNVIDYISCHAVIMHTQDPAKTFAELSRLLKRGKKRGGGAELLSYNTSGGQLACYAYAKKALPRELLDDYFRTQCHNLSHAQLREMSEQLSELGKRLQDLKVEIDSPAIPLLGIKGGKYDIQRFIYWNFLKCFYNEELGLETSITTNYDWYSPSNAKRFSAEEFKQFATDNVLSILHFHAEEACFGARFCKDD